MKLSELFARPSLKSVVTRFRAYQLGVAGSSFSYFAGNHFTLIEGMATEQSQPNILAELKACGKSQIDTLHITSWDLDHCSPAGLSWILRKLQPNKIELPGYEPAGDCAKECYWDISAYLRDQSARGRKVSKVSYTPDYVKGLSPAEAWGYRTICYHPRQIWSKANDNSTVKFFRTGSFNVLSMGDVESAEIGAYLRRCPTLCREIDVLLLAHHGADNGLTTKNFLEALKPKLAIASSNYGNQYDHPDQAVRNMLSSLDIKLMTTKRGDVLVKSSAGHTVDYEAFDLMANSQETFKAHALTAKKSKLLSMNADTIRNIQSPGGFRRR